MESKNLKYLIIGVFTLLFTSTATAQNVYTLNKKNSKLTVSGTSSLHDWEMEATGFSAETGLTLKGNAVLEIQYVEFTSPVDGLESDKNIMNNKAHDALKEKKSPQIKFHIEREGVKLLSENKAELTGKLTTAGKTKEIKVPVDFTISSELQFKVRGKVPLKMSDFGVEPPTAILGTVKTDDEVEVDFNFEFYRSN
jgi:polyisoprenoid-binding protein YceI